MAGKPARTDEQKERRRQREAERRVPRLTRGEVAVGKYAVNRDVFWATVRHELLTNEQTRELCGALTSGTIGTPVTRVTLLRWREGIPKRPKFPPPVMVMNEGTPRMVELWSRSDVEHWLTDADRKESP